MGNYVAKFGPYYIEEVNIRENGFVIHHSNKRFEDFHTHVNSKNLAISLAKCAYKKTLPKRKNERNIISLIRITDDPEFKEELEDLLGRMIERHRVSYANRPKVLKRK